MCFLLYSHMGMHMGMLQMRTADLGSRMSRVVSREPAIASEFLF